MPDDIAQRVPSDKPPELLEFTRFSVGWPTGRVRAVCRLRVGCYILTACYIGVGAPTGDDNFPTANKRRASVRQTIVSRIKDSHGLSSIRSAFVRGVVRGSQVGKVGSRRPVVILTPRWAIVARCQSVGPSRLCPRGRQAGPCERDQGTPVILFSDVPNLIFLMFIMLQSTTC